MFTIISLALIVSVSAGFATATIHIERPERIGYDK
jgi:hypothetical protein